MSENLYDRIDAMRVRVDALFPNKGRGYGEDMRNLLRLAEEHSRGWTLSYCESILSIVDELLIRMEIDERERIAFDEYVTRMEAEALSR